jgi:AbrB family looped-hinge helix DNA binding protein
MPTLGKVTAKGQTTIPQEVRAALRIEPGDLLLWELGHGAVVQVKKVQPIDLAYLRALDGTLDEWSSPADDEAYREL